MKKSYFLLFLILLLASFMRFFRLEENLVFHAEIGHNYLFIKNFIAKSEIPLIGPPTSHPWLEFGPLFFWIMAPVMIISSYNPLGPAVFMEMLSVFVVILNYIVISKLFNKKAALLSSLLISVSPYFLWLGRESRFFSIVVLLVYPYLYLLEGILKGNRHYILWLGITLGLMFNFHYTPLVLLFSLPLIFFVSWYHAVRLGGSASSLINSKFESRNPKQYQMFKIKKNLKIKILDLFRYLIFDIRIFLIFILGLLIPCIPLLIYDAGQKFAMLRNLIIWIPYRIVSSFGLYSLHQSSPVNYISTPSNIADFIGATILTEKNILNTIFILAIAFFIFFILHRFFFIKSMNNRPLFIITALLSLGFLMLAVHGSPPLHYFVPLAPLPLILFSVLVCHPGPDCRQAGLDPGSIHSEYRNLDSPDLIGGMTRYVMVISAVLLMIIIFINSRYYFSREWFYTPGKLVINGKHIPYQLEKEVARYIVSDARGQPFSLHRVGAMDSYEGEFSQNYRYLLWLYGNEPKDKKVGLTYTIYDNPTQQNMIQAVNIKRIGNITIIKE